MQWMVKSATISVDRTNGIDVKEAAGELLLVKVEVVVFWLLPTETYRVSFHWWPTPALYMAISWSWSSLLSHHCHSEVFSKWNATKRNNINLMASRKILPLFNQIRVTFLVVIFSPIYNHLDLMLKSSLCDPWGHDFNDYYYVIILYYITNDSNYV